MGQVPVSLLGATGPTIYHIYIEATHIAGCEEVAIEGVTHTEVISKSATVSDVSNVYKCLIDDIVALQATCADKSIQDRVIRNYLMLYAHQEALQLNYLDEGRKWFKYLQNCGNSCSSPDRDINVGCGCKDNVSPVNDCGCRK